MNANFNTQAETKNTGDEAVCNGFLNSNKSSVQV
jgi:hypothetical protein